MSDQRHRALVWLSTRSNRLSRIPQGRSLFGVVQTLTALIGCFDLDPNRVLDLMLSSLEFHCGGPVSTLDGHLYLVQQSYHCTSLTYMLGLKFNQNFGCRTQGSLYRLAAILLGAGAVHLEDLLPYFACSLETIAVKTRKLAKEAHVDARLLGVVSLTTSKKKTSNSELLHEMVETSKTRESGTSQAFGLLEALLWDRRWHIAQPLLSRLEQIGAIPSNDAECRHALLSLAHFVVDSIYTTISPRKLGLTQSHKALRVHLGTDDKAMSRPHNILEQLCCHLHVYVAFDVSLMTKLAHVAQYLIISKRSQIETDAARRILAHVLLPALSLLPSTPGFAFLVWKVVKLFPYRDRQMIYANWRGRGVEIKSVGSKNFDVTLVECKAGRAARQTLKRVANEKKNYKQAGRALAKVAHSNPLVVFHVILAQVESYDNMIQPIVESLAFMTPLALDVLSYVLQFHLADNSRPKLQQDGINIARWFQNLAHFAGAYYRSYPQAEIGYLIDFLLIRLETGHSIELLVFSELLTRMGGSAVLEDISDAQIGGLAGGETLRREMLAFDKAPKRSMSKLLSALCTPSTAIPMLALIAQSWPA